MFILASKWRLSWASRKPERITDTSISVLVTLRNELKDLCSVDDYRDISSTIHQLNSHVYDSLVALKHNKLAGLINSTTQEAIVDASTPVPKIVVTIPQDIQLDSHERSSLQKGLNYIPTRKHCDEYTATIVSACNCPTELIATYLDEITTSLVQSLPSYVKDTNHMFRIADSFRFPGTSNYVFNMDVKSLYTVIANGDGLLALTHFLNKRPVLQPPTHTLVRLAELVLTLNTFSFNWNFYRQTGGVAMRSRLGPNYACLFMGHVEEQIFAQYTYGNETSPVQTIYL